MASSSETQPASVRGVKRTFDGMIEPAFVDQPLEVPLAPQDEGLPSAPHPAHSVDVDDEFWRDLGFDSDDSAGAPEAALDGELTPILSDWPEASQRARDEPLGEQASAEQPDLPQDGEEEEAGEDEAGDMPLGERHTLVLNEPVNMHMLRQFLSSSASRALLAEERAMGYTITEHAIMILERCVAVKGDKSGIVWVPSVWFSNPRCDELGVPGRWVVTADTANVSKAVKEHAVSVGNVPERMCILPLVALPRVLRDLCRVGCQVKDYDMPNAQLNCMVFSLMSDADRDRFPMLARTACARDECVQAVMGETDCAAAKAKQLLIATINGSGDAPVALKQVSVESRAFVGLLGQRYPGLLAKVQAWGKSRPGYTLLFYLWTAIEAAAIHEMAGDTRYCSYEFDGLVYRRMPKILRT